MDFGLSSEQVQLQDTIRRFLAERCPTTRVRAIMESDSGHDADLWQGLADLGVAGLQVPVEHGGAGLDLLDVALAAQELGYAATPGPFLANAMAVVGLREGDDEAARAAWLPRIAAGEAIGAVAIGEADGVWQPGALTARVTGGRLSGDKPLVHGAAAAALLLVAAVDDDGPGLFLAASNAPGIERRALHVVDMTRRVDAVSFRDTPVVRIGGAAVVQRTLDAGCVLVAADAWGGSRRALDMAIDYARQREQFGQIIGAFQAVKHQLADLATELEPALSLWWYAAHAFDHIRDQSERHAAIVKAHLGDVFDRVTRMSTELHGGIGFTWEYDLQLWFRRAVFDRAWLGDARFHRARAAELAGW
jgi:alkylation response protein AidB-like acyl-CoA dehydrogenase